MYEEDLDMYGIPYPDGDPLTGLIIVVILIVLWHLLVWINDKLMKWYDNW
jgi:hypothetical protein